MSRHKRRKPRFGRVTSLLLVLLGLALLTALALHQFDKQILPSILASAEMSIKTKMNDTIYRSVNDIIKQRNLSASDFYIKNDTPDGSGNSLSVNTILVSDLCNTAALDISNTLDSMGEQRISIPIGSVLSVKALANFGPAYTVSLLPAGNAEVNYESKFEAVGINQINFQVWLHVSSTVRIVNPIQSNVIEVDRDVPLVNTIISGEVPNSYFNVNPQSLQTP